MKAKEREQEEARARLREWVKPGDTIFTILRHCSRSGMSRVIQLVKFENDSPCWLGFNVAAAIGATYDREREGVKVGGCGMDMGFHLVYELSHALFGEGFGCLGKDCPSNDHSNGDRSDQPHSVTPSGLVVHSHWHKSGGYALKHRWL